MTAPRDQFVVDVILFDGFDLLDVSGPVELLSFAPGVQLRFVGTTMKPIPSSQGARLLPDASLLHAPQDVDLLLVPGGWGTRTFVKDELFHHTIVERAGAARIVSSVCTGSALLAQAGVLNGYRATSNKAAFDWVSSLGVAVEWQPRARWVHDRDRWTSSGVTAGMDMAYALISDEFGQEYAIACARRAEFEPHMNPDVDPFAERYDWI